MIYSKLLNGAFLNIALTISSAFLSFYSLMLIGSEFGASQGTDVYFYIVTLVTTITGILSGVLGSIYLPSFIMLGGEHQKDAREKYASSVFTSLLLLSIFLFSTLVLLDINFYKLASQFEIDKYSNMYNLFKYTPYIILLSIINEFFRITALSFEKFLMVSLTTIIPPFFLIITVKGFSEIFHEEALTLSYLISKFASIFLLYTFAIRNNISLNLKISKDSNFSKLLKNSTPYIFSDIVTNIATMFVSYQASGMGKGITSSLSYASRLYSIPINLFILPIIEVYRVKFSILYAQNKIIEFTSLVQKITLIVIYTMIPVSILYYTSGFSIVSSLFHTKNISDSDLKIISEFFSIYSISIPAASIFIVIGRAIEVYQKMLWPSIFGAIGHSFSIIIIIIFCLYFGPVGIPYTKVLLDIFYFLPLALTFFYLNAKNQTINYKKIINSSLYALVISSLCSHVFFLIHEALNINNLLLNLVVSMLIYFTVYFACLTITSSKIRELALSLRFGKFK